MKVDHRRFLGRSEERVLPYLGGPFVVAEDRGLRVQAAVPAGWWRFRVEGRKATAMAPAEAPEGALAALPSVVGHWSGARLAHGAAEAETVHLLPEDELPRFTPCRARRWHSGELLYERTELEGEGEEVTRRIFEERRPLAGMKGIAGSLRAAFAYAVLAEVAQRVGVPVSPLEVRRQVGEVAEQGWAEAERVLHHLHHERAVQGALARARAAAGLRHVAAIGRDGDPVIRAAEALTGSGAVLLDTRRMADGLMAVTYRFLGERLSAVVRADTLQVVDAGVCVAGHDEELTLDSLPGVIREGVQTGQLMITRHD